VVSREGNQSINRADLRGNGQQKKRCRGGCQWGKEYGTSRLEIPREGKTRSKGSRDKGWVLKHRVEKKARGKGVKPVSKVRGSRGFRYNREVWGERKVKADTGGKFGESNA